MAKIKANFYKDVTEGRIGIKTISFNIGDELVEIELKNYLTAEKKTEMATDLLKYLEANAKDIGIDEEKMSIVLLLSILKHITDIEFPDTLDGQLEQLNALADLGILDKILTELRPGLAEECSIFIKEYAEKIMAIASDLEKQKQVGTEVVDSQESSSEV